MWNNSKSQMKLDLGELLAHAVLVSEHASMRGYLMKQGRVNTGSWKKRYFCLKGPTLYYFRTQDPSTCIGLVCVANVHVEAGSLDELGVPDNLMSGWGAAGQASSRCTGLSITTCGGRKITLVAPSQEARDDWCAKLRMLKDDTRLCEQRKTRRTMLHTTESASTIGSRYGSEESPARSPARQLSTPTASTGNLTPRSMLREKESIMEDLAQAYEDIEAGRVEAEELRGALADAQGAVHGLEQKLAHVERERDEALSRCHQLHMAKGVVVQTPTAGPSLDATAGDTGPVDLRVWVGTWNLGVTEPFNATELRGQAPQLLREKFVPSNYDLYVLGVQEAASEKIFGHVEALLGLEGVRRVKFVEDEQKHKQPQIDGECSPSVPDLHRTRSKSPAKSPAPPPKNAQTMPRVDGRGDGSLLSSKFTGLAIFVSERLRKRGFKVISSGGYGLDRFSSKGAAAVGVAIANGAGTAVTLAFLSSHLEAGDKSETRNHQYRELSEKVSGLICAPGLEVTTQFHHVIWVGDLNYRCLEADGGPLMKPDSVLNALERGEARKLYDCHDGLNIARKVEDVFYRYRESQPFPDFFPTYKLVEDRGPADPTKPGWARQHYCTRYKEPFYKGGAVKDRTPGFCDRILFHSQVDSQNVLQPESVEVPLEILHEQDDGGSIARSPLCTRLHNYRTVSGGEGFATSDHAPVFATFRLHLSGPPIGVGTTSDDEDSPDLPFSLNSSTEIAEVAMEAFSSCKFSDGTASPSRRESCPLRLPAELASGTGLESLLAIMLGTGPVALRVAGLRIAWGQSASVHPIGGEVTFPAPWEADFGSSGEPAVDLLPASGIGWQGSRAVANGDVASSAGSLRATLSPQAATAQEGVPDLVLSWNGIGGGATLSHLHLLIRVLLPENLADACSRTRGDDRQSNEQLVSQASLSLGPLLSAAAEARRRNRVSDREGHAADEEGSSGSETETLCHGELQGDDDLVAHACEPLIRQGMPEYVVAGGSRQQCMLKCELRVKVIDAKELETRKRLTRFRMMEAEARKTKRKQKEKKTSNTGNSTGSFHSDGTHSQELPDNRGGGWLFSHHRTCR